MTIIEKRQLMARMALAMDELTEGKTEEVVKVENGYDWVAPNGEVIIKMRLPKE